MSYTGVQWLVVLLRSVFSAEPKTVFQTSDKSFGTILLLAHATKARPYKPLCELITRRGEHCSPAKFHTIRCLSTRRNTPDKGCFCLKMQFITYPLQKISVLHIDLQVLSIINLLKTPYHFPFSFRNFMHKLYDNIHIAVHSVLICIAGI